MILKQLALATLLLANICFGYNSEVSISVADWSTLNDKLDGHVTLPTDDSYASDYVEWTATYDHIYPEAIVFCESENDATLVMNFLLEHGIDSDGNIVDFRCRNCRHSLAGWSTTDGIIVDTSGIDHLYIENGKGIVGPGVDLYTFTTFAEEHNFTLPHGDCSSVCFGGFLLGGGFGLTSRTFGMGIDWINSINIVLPTGEFVTASEDNEFSDLFWALRGGGQGNFGIVTSFEMNVPVKQQQNPGLYIEITWNYAENTWNTVSNVWNDFVSNDEFGTHFAMYLRVTPSSWLSLDYSVGLHGFWTGEQPDGLKVMAALLSAINITPASSKIDYVPFEGWIGHSSEDRTRYSSHCSSRFAFTLLDSTVFDVLQDYTRQIKSFDDYDADDEDESTYGIPAQFLFIAPAGGAISDKANTDTAFPWRGATYFFNVCVRWMNDYDNVKEFVEEWLNNLMNELTDGTKQGYLSPDAAFVNFPDNNIENWELVYYGENYPKLQKVKAKYDPNNHFSYAYSIVPVDADVEETMERQEAQTLTEKPSGFITLIDTWLKDQDFLDDENTQSSSSSHAVFDKTLVGVIAGFLGLLLVFVIFKLVQYWSNKNKINATEYSPLNTQSTYA